MTEAAVNRARAPWHLWVVGGLSLLWNAVGAFDYLMTQSRAEFYVSGLTPEQIAHFESFPAWMHIAWTFGVWGAVLGSVALLMRSRWAAWLFGLSLAGLLASSVYNFGMTDGIRIMGGNAVVLFNVAIWLVAILLLWYALAMRRRGVMA